MRLDIKIFARATLDQLATPSFVNIVPRIAVRSRYSAARTAVIAVVIFVVAHVALLIGVTTPEKFVFDEVHYVPAARQMLEPVHAAADAQSDASAAGQAADRAVDPRASATMPLGWRYPGVLFGALAIVAVYLCGLALFAAQGPAIAAALIAFFNQMLFVQSRIAMLDIFALAFGLFAIAAFMHGFRQPRPHLWFALAGLGFGLVGRLQMERIVSARDLHRHRRRDPADARLAHAICRRQRR